MTQLVAINGLKHSGKTTAAQVLVDAGWVRVKFAGPLKDMLRTLDLDDRHLEGDLKEVPCDLLCGQTPRWAMQSLGTEWGRDLIGVDLWGGIARRRIADALAAGKSVVVDDLRFESEAAAIRAMGGVVLRIERPGLVGGGHASETPVVADIVHENSGTVAELRGFMAAVWLGAGPLP